jgi:hypothetical protein
MRIEMIRVLLLLLALRLSAPMLGQLPIDEGTLNWLASLEEVEFKMDHEKFECCDSSIISTHIAYEGKMSSHGFDLGAQPTYTYRWIRFSTDGRVCLSWYYSSYPTFDEMNDFKYVKYGRYRVEKDKLIIEWPLGKDDRNVFMFARKVPSGVEFYADAKRRHGWVRFRKEGYPLYEKSNYTFSTWPESNVVK